MSFKQQFVRNFNHPHDIPPLLIFFRLYKVVYHRNNWNYFASFGNSCNGYLRQDDKEVSWKF